MLHYIVINLSHKVETKMHFTIIVEAITRWQEVSICIYYLDLIALAYLPYRCIEYSHCNIAYVLHVNCNNSR